MFWPDRGDISSISLLQEQGIVAKRRNSIEILDIGRLESVTKLEAGA